MPDDPPTGEIRIVEEDPSQPETKESRRLRAVKACDRCAEVRRKCKRDHRTDRCLSCVLQDGQHDSIPCSWTNRDAFRKKREEMDRAKKSKTGSERRRGGGGNHGPVRPSPYEQPGQSSKTVARSSDRRSASPRQARGAARDRPPQVDAAPRVPAHNKIDAVSHPFRRSSSDECDVAPEPAQRRSAPDVPIAQPTPMRSGGQYTTSQCLVRSGPRPPPDRIVDQLFDSMNPTQPHPNVVYHCVECLSELGSEYAKIFKESDWNERFAAGQLPPLLTNALVAFAARYADQRSFSLFNTYDDARYAAGEVYWQQCQTIHKEIVSSQQRHETNFDNIHALALMSWVAYGYSYMDLSRSYGEYAIGLLQSLDNGDFLSSLGAEGRDSKWWELLMLQWFCVARVDGALAWGVYGAMAWDRTSMKPQIMSAKDSVIMQRYALSASATKSAAMLQISRVQGKINAFRQEILSSNRSVPELQASILSVSSELIRPTIENFRSFRKVGAGTVFVQSILAFFCYAILVHCPDYLSFPSEDVTSQHEFTDKELDFACKLATSLIKFVSEVQADTGDFKMVVGGTPSLDLLFAPIAKALVLGQRRKRSDNNVLQSIRVFTELISTIAPMWANLQPIEFELHQVQHWFIHRSPSPDADERRRHERRDATSRITAAGFRPVRSVGHENWQTVGMTPYEIAWNVIESPPVSQQVFGVDMDPDGNAKWFSVTPHSKFASRSIPDLEDMGATSQVAGTQMSPQPTALYQPAQYFQYDNGGVHLTDSQMPILPQAWDAFTMNTTHQLGSNNVLGQGGDTSLPAGSYGTMYAAGTGFVTEDGDCPFAYTNGPATGPHFHNGFGY